ncbi:MAG: hypothetical protein AUK47_03905 [Deltaproteobacteria bacterium CG2_30_63_29]|nr:MAG: hypothetical protein AUK47_03905 [Deltaproteobacteria bacterium CG2_30_63_29]PJB39861.1 MAG: hypothetical protein CO108_16310 [Deltaproteobacteria bacterium CG_4_9_14_3_um_filter_63_12]
MNQDSQNRFVWGLIAGVGVCLLLLVVFLLGRASKDDAPTPPVPPVARVDEEPEPYPDEEPEPAARKPYESLLQQRRGPPAGGSSTTPGLGRAGSRLNSLDPPDDSTFRSLDPSGGAPSTGVRRDPRQDRRIFGRAATGTAAGGGDVLDYLDDAERIMEGGKFWADDEAFAESLLVATMTGNNGELERLLESLRGVRQELGALSPPATASAYHRETLGVLDSGISLLEKLSEAIASQDPSAMMTFPALAEELTRRAEKADAMGKALRGE